VQGKVPAPDRATIRKEVHTALRGGGVNVDDDDLEGPVLYVEQVRVYLPADPSLSTPTHAFVRTEWLSLLHQ
jgi:hypothetical protein